MSSLRDLFDINFELVLFASGLAYFVMGLAVNLQPRQHSRLELARGLGWLSLFGIAHGLHEWGLLFVPIQALYMSHLAISLLQLIQILLLGTAFFALFAFGAELLSDRAPLLRLSPYLMASLWLAILVVLDTSSDLGVGWLHQQAAIWGKYLLAFPGGLLAAYGLWYQAEMQIKSLNLRSIYRMTRVASGTLLLYAIFGALFVPYGDFFPANWLNQSILVMFTGVPQPTYLSLIGLVLAVTVTRILTVFDLENRRLIEQMRLEQGLSEERDRIGRELHDGAIQMVYTAGLIIESARRRVEEDAVLSQRLDRAMTALNETVATLRTNMKDLRADSLAASLADGLRLRAQDPRLATLMSVELSLDLPDSLAFDPAQTTHILAIVGEALTNAARHGRPSNALVQARCENGQFLLTVRDDGAGFTPHPSGESGYGLRNMRDRARLLGGELTIESKRGKGSCVTLKVPWKSA